MIFKSKRAELEKTQEKCIKNMIKEVDTMIDDTIRGIFLIKDVDDLNIDEKDKVRYRKILINNSINKLLNKSEKIKELSKTANLR